MKFGLLNLLLLTSFGLFGQVKYTISGYVKDAQNGESLIGATILIKGTSIGTTSNVYGFYSLTLEAGNHNIEYRYIGYGSTVKEVVFDQNQSLNVELSVDTAELQEVIITGEEDTHIEGIEMSTEKLAINTIQKIPALFGEVDVLRSIQLLPGVSSVGEGTSGYNVRGGSVGQNLVLLDEAPVYNSSHLFGFFSVFNPDAVKDVKLIKGGIPSTYGGRLSSILDVRMKEGNAKELEVSGGIGFPVFSRLAIQGPIKNDKASFIVAGRRSYLDIFAKPFTNDATLYFYDLTTKVNYNINENNRLYLSGYFGRDVFKFDERQGFDWGSITTTLRWNHLFNDRLFSNTSFFISKYDYGFSFGDNDMDKFDWKSSILTYTLKPTLNYYLNTNNELTFGGELTYYDFKPAKSVGVSDGVVTDISLNEKYALENALYLDNTQKLGDVITIRYGLRFSAFQYYGPGNKYEYEDNESGERKTLINITPVERRELVQSYANLEPRASISYLLGEKRSLKASFTRTNQYIHLISNTAEVTPIDVWTPSTNNVKPQQGNQYALGYNTLVGKHDLELSVEAYFRKTSNQIEYVNGADLLINELIEGDLISGKGRAYGIEFSLKKNEGKLNGWISYTIGRSELKAVGINRDDWYPARFDQLHNLSVFANYDINKRSSFSANFSYISGTPVTAPTSRYTIQGILIPYDFYNSRNGLRIPSTHRLDVSFIRKLKRVKNGTTRKNEDELVFSIYNVYFSKNPFSIFFGQEDGRTKPGEPINTQANQFSIIGSFVPSISYNFNF